MKKSLLFLITVFVSVLGFSQSYDTVSVEDIQFVSQTDLANCNDTSAYFGDTVVVYGIVVHDGNLTELASGSVTGGYRPGVHIVDTSMAGTMGSFRGVQVHGVYDGNNPVNALDQLQAGTVVRVTGNIGRFAGETQLNPISNNAVQAITITSAPTSIPINLGDLNDDNRVNQFETGEQYEGAFVELTNVTVVAVTYFSGGSRVSFDVVDANGNTINVSDRFLAQKLSSHTTLNAQSPASTGSFSVPPVGTVFSSLKGIILHSDNGCTGNSGRGYEINPFDASHYQIGVAPPNFSDIERNPVFPTTSDAPVVTCKITDFDGTISSAQLFYTVGVTNNTFAAINMTLVSGTTDEYEATIPAQAEGDIVKYYLEATDNDNNVTTVPFTPASQTTSNAYHYTVRDNGVQIIDIQRVLDYGNGTSAYDGEEVTVTGIVTSSLKDFDLGYVYIQQEGETEWAGITLLNNADLFSLFRGDEVTVTGTVQEIGGSLTSTAINVTTLARTGAVKTVNPVVLSPTDSAMYAEDGMRPYEGMLVEMSNGGSDMYISNADRGFGEFQIATSATANDENSTRVLTARQSSFANSSLWVSLVTDDYYQTNDGVMEVDTVITTEDMTMTSLTGIIAETFGTYKVLPRNNDDIVGLAENGTPIELDTTNLPSSIVDYFSNQVIKLYPNPTNDVITVEVEDLAQQSTVINVFDLTGRKVNTTVMNSTKTLVDLTALDRGIYILNLSTERGESIATQKIILE